MKTPIHALVLCALFAAAGCGGGGGGGLRSEPDAPAPREDAEAPAPRPQPPQPPPLPPVSCIRTALGCLSPAQYQEERRTIEDGHAGGDGFRNQWGLSAVRADRAWAQLELEHGGGTAPGGGVTVGVVDTGIDAGHPVFAGKTVSEEFLDGAPDETGDRVSHGTAVAGVIAARPDASFTGAVDAAPGVAWGADLAVFALRTRESGGVYVPVSLPGLGGGDDDPWASRVRRVTDWRRGGRTVDFVNVSVGFHGIIDQYGERQLRDGLGGVIDALAQPGAADKTVFVWAAGNAHGDLCEAADFSADPDLCVEAVEGGETVRRVDARSVEILPGLPARISELRGHLIAVVAVAPDGDGDGDYEIAPFSNRCGIAREWCLAAPGAAVRVAYFGPHPDDGSPGARGATTLSGTSFAAPMVTGGLAVMKQFFRGQLSNTDLAARLLETADRRGVYADADTYGRGLMDLAAATAPVGDARIASGGRVDRSGAGVAATSLVSGPALGDGPARALAGREIAAFDALGAPFWFSLGDLAGAAPGPSVAARLRAFMAPSPEDRRPGADGLRIGLLEEPSADAGGGHLSLAGRALAVRAAAPGGLGLAVFSNEGLRGRSPASGAVLSWGPSGAPLGLRGGLVAERETLLGSRAAGAFGRLSAGSAFAGVDGSARIGAWRLAAGAEVGVASAAAADGILAGLSPLFSSAFALRAERRTAGAGSLLLSVSQPLRVEAGRARLSVPVGRTKDGQVLRRPLTADLAPSGRQVEVAARWRRPLAAGGELRLGASWTRQPGHAASADADVSLFAGWRRAF